MYYYWSSEPFYLTEKDENGNTVGSHVYQNYRELLRHLSTMTIGVKENQLVRTWYFDKRIWYLTIRDVYNSRLNAALVEKDIRVWKEKNPHREKRGRRTSERHLAKGCRFRVDPVRLSYDDPSPRNCKTGHRPVRTSFRHVRNYANIEREYHYKEYAKYLRKKARTEDPWAKEPWIDVSRSWKDQSKCRYQWERLLIAQADKGEEVMVFNRKKEKEITINKGGWDYDNADETERQVFDIVMELAHIPVKKRRKKAFDLSSRLWDDLQIDSLDRYELLCLLEEKFQMEIEGDGADKILQAWTIQDVADGMKTAAP